HRQGSLTYTPGTTDTPQFIFYPDTLTPYNLSENRSFNVLGLKLDYTQRFSERWQLKAGVQASRTGGHEVFVTQDVAGNKGRASNPDLAGNDVAGYLQAVIAPSEKWELRPGVRYDTHDAPFAPNERQWTPRIKLSFFPDPAS